MGPEPCKREPCKRIADLWPLHLHHVPEVAAIERRAFDWRHAWTEADFRGLLVQPHIHGSVIISQGRILGYSLFEVLQSRIVLANLAVDYDFRRCGLATALVRDVLERLEREGSRGRHTEETRVKGPRGNRLTVEVRETNVAAQLLLQACGLRWVKTLRGYYTTCADDCYVFELSKGSRGRGAKGSSDSLLSVDRLAW